MTTTRLLKKTVAVLDQLPCKSVDSFRLAVEIELYLATHSYVCPVCDEKPLDNGWNSSTIQRELKTCTVCGKTWTVLTPAGDSDESTTGNHEVVITQSHLHH